MDRKESTPIKAIDFKSLNKPSETSTNLEQKVTKNSILLITFLFLVACGVGVFLFLPQFVPERVHLPSVPIEAVKEEPAPQNFPQPIVEEIPKLSAEEINQLKLQAENLLLKVIKKQESLLEKGVNKWAEEEFNIALSLGSSGDEYFRTQIYSDAITSYHQAIDALDLLEDKVAPTLSKNLNLGEQALLQANRETALFHFELAKAIDAKNVQALNGIKRAETIEELFNLLEEGGNLEAANRLDDAKQIYQKALDLDPLSSEAKNAVNRVSNRLVEQKFTQLLAEGYKSFESRQYNDARSAFLSAQKLSPDSSEAKQGLTKVAQAVRNEKIATLTVEAQHFESREEWSYAVQSYQQILNLNSSSSLAKDGIARSQKRASLLTGLDNYLDNEERLYSAQVAKEALELLDEVELMDAPGNKISQRVKKLKEYLVIANQPISITLHSDNQTDVAIFKVGKFGRFENYKLELKPGKYTIVGSRSGYRDVRKVLTVSAEMANKNIIVRCEEPI